VGLDDSTRILTTKFLSSELKKNKSIIYTSHIPIDIDSETITLGGNQV
jgi:ABC-type multidrug transport system ATPase subunit